MHYRFTIILMIFRAQCRDHKSICRLVNICVISVEILFQSNDFKTLCKKRKDTCIKLKTRFDTYLF